MEINQARKLQKELFRASESSRKRMRIMLFSGKLYYTVSHYMGENSIYLNPCFGRINEAIKSGVEIEIGYIDHIPYVPKGLLPSVSLVFKNHVEVMITEKGLYITSPEDIENVQHDMIHVKTGKCCLRQNTIPNFWECK